MVAQTLLADSASQKVRSEIARPDLKVAKKSRARVVSCDASVTLVI